MLFELIYDIICQCVAHISWFLQSCQYNYRVGREEAGGELLPSRTCNEILLMWPGPGPDVEEKIDF